MVSTTGQTIFWQINLGNSSISSQNGSISWCPDYETAQSNEFCLDDDIRNYGGQWVTPGQFVNNTVEILPRILQVLAMNHSKTFDVNGVINTYTIDSNPANWIINGVYFGLITQGQANTTTQWASPAMNTMPGGNFCSAGNTIQYSCGAGQPSGQGWVNVGNTCYQRNSGKPCF